VTTRGQVNVQYVDQVPVVDCAGEIDLTNVHELETALNQAARSDVGTVIVTLVNTTYLDSQGLRVIFSVGERLTTARQRLLLVASPGSTPRRILEVAGMERTYRVFATVEDALAHRIR
jgi:anti-anti-sigma factor